MGYTRHWTTAVDLDGFPAEFMDSVHAIVDTAKGDGIELTGGMEGDMPVEINEFYIALNGPTDSSDGNDLSYEDFVIRATSGVWSFCKTARMPYDIVVGAILRVAQEHGVISYLEVEGGNEEAAIDDLLTRAKDKIAA